MSSISLIQNNTKPIIQPRDKWFLSFDCATKSFAYALLRIRYPDSELVIKMNALKAAIAANNLQVASKLVNDIDEESRNYFYLAAGNAINLIPDKKDKDISTIERVKATSSYLRNTIANALIAAAADGCPSPDSTDLNVVIEFQLGANAHARTVAITLLAHYSNANIFMVGPAYKNKLWYPSRPDLRHCYYIERYSTLYTANKNHAKDLYFNHIASIFNHDNMNILKQIPIRLRKDFADCVVQVLGYIAYGDIENATTKF